MSSISKLQIIDSHTAGEPTRVIVGGFPELAGKTAAEKLHAFRNEFDFLRRAVIKEPRGFDAVVGALLCEPSSGECAAGVIFFNNVGFLGMCGHGTIGLMKTLAYLGKIKTGSYKIETPVGIVEAAIDERETVTIRNVPSYRFASKISIEVEGYGAFEGDIAYGGNWFFLIEKHPFELNLKNLVQLTRFTSAVRETLAEQKITGANGHEIDHIELFAPTETADSRNFVLCPGIEYDRSPCGTGTSAKLACLYTDGKIREGEVWRQESIIGSCFESSVEIVDNQIVPIIRGAAYITAESSLIFDANDPFRFGIE